MVRLLVLLVVLLAGPSWAQTAPLEPGGARLMILHDRSRPVVTEMVKLTLRGEYDLTVALENLRFPDSEHYDWMQIAQDRWFRERIGGRMIQIFERDIALFPRHAGEFEVGPVVHELTHVPRSGNRVAVQVASAPAHLNVAPFPHGSQPLTAKALVLTDELSAQPGQLGADEVLTRRVTIEALGTLAHHLPERPDLQQPWLISFTQPELRETTPTPEGPVSRVVWEWQLRPRTGEPGVLPGFAFPWFDTDTRQIETASMQPLPFGLAGFGSNVSSGAADTVRQFGLAALIAAAGFAVTLSILLWGRLPAVPPAIRRLRPNPHTAALKRAAAQGDLLALRSAAERHAMWRGRIDAEQDRLLSLLDHAIFDAKADQHFHPDDWLAEFLRRRRRRERGTGAAASSETSG
ncbi:Oxygen tolerance [Paracoccus tibetensis]|uniref:Oxygen tolerance n=2 Tax=Paracoccus tibetensis TaxID=336292 RepID=A0A1G5K4V6_9RHOB|nr:Oxygen tolerance [Paracoccus tibetensis]